MLDKKSVLIGLIAFCIGAVLSDALKNITAAQYLYLLIFSLVMTWITRGKDK